VFAATVPPSLGPGAAAAIGRVLVAAVPASPGPGAAAAIGQAPAAGDPAGGRVGLVAMGDLSACRTEQAPGAFRAEAAGFDASVAEAFRTGKPERLLDLDPTQAGELLVGGRVPLQVLAGACDAGPAMRGQVLYDDTPYGVGYLVALLTAP
jgi:aromatic ring-opening dioxygenase LigB subunit